MPLKLRRLLETHGLTAVIFASLRDHLARKGLLLREGTIVDETLIAAPASTNNRDGRVIQTCIRPGRAIRGTSA